ncbi:MAG: DUF6677 family protein [Blastocatellia bacterium]
MQSETSTGKSFAGALARPEPVSPAHTTLAVVCSMVLPGLGHIVLGKVIRGLIVLAVVSAMFALGIMMKGHLMRPEPNDWLSYLFTFCNLGIGAPYFVCRMLNFGFELTNEQILATTFEYGKTFLLVSGLLNYLAMLDTFDIAVGRKS